MEENEGLRLMGLQNAAHVLVVCLAGLLTVGCQALSSTVGEEAARAIPLNHLPAIDGDYFELNSDHVGRPFHIYVRYPEGYEEGDRSYPVVYILDGDSLFPILAANHLFLTYDEGLPEAIVVGIAYGSFDSSVNRRGFDFSAPAPDSGPEQGGAPAFSAFLRHELIPVIDRRYRTDPERRVLFGQSRGGYLVLYSAFTEPDLFWGRIASNPSFDPGRERFFLPPAAASRGDLGLVVTSGSRDYPVLRESALAWRDAWRCIDQRPWALNFVTIQGGTHAAHSMSSYREGMVWLFGREGRD